MKIFKYNVYLVARQCGRIKGNAYTTNTGKSLIIPNEEMQVAEGIRQAKAEFYKKIDELEKQYGIIVGDFEIEYRSSARRFEPHIFRADWETKEILMKQWDSEYVPFYTAEEVIENAKSLPLPQPTKRRVVDGESWDLENHANDVKGFSQPWDCDEENAYNDRTTTIF